MTPDPIDQCVRVRGASENNLRNVDVDIPRDAMVAFTGMDSLTRWNAEARPVPVTLDLAAASARQEGASALLVDLDGPHPLAIDGDILDQLAAGHRLVDIGGGEFGWAVPADRG